jgi:hypothetical protein
MNKYLLCSLLLAVACNAAQKGEEKRDSSANSSVGMPAVVDTAQVVAAFDLLKDDSVFLDKMDLLSEGTYAFYDEERPLLIGDINRDSLPDALMPFSIEGLGGGNNYTSHYAILLNQGGRLEYNSVLYRGNKLSENMLTFTGITNGVIEGWELPGFHHPEADSIYVQYAFRNGKLEETVREN